MCTYLRQGCLPTCNIVSLADLNVYVFTYCVRKVRRYINQPSLINGCYTRVIHSSDTHSKCGQLATLDYSTAHANFKIRVFLAPDCTLLGNCLVWSLWSVMQHFLLETVPRARHICFLNFWLDTDQRNTTTLFGWFRIFVSLRLNFSYIAWYCIGFLEGSSKELKNCANQRLFHNSSLVWSVTCQLEGASLQINYLTSFRKCGELFWPMILLSQGLRIISYYFCIFSLAPIALLLASFWIDTCIYSVMDVFGQATMQYICMSSLK